MPDDGTVLTQFLAIMEYVEETHPEPPLRPEDPEARARVRAFAPGVACEIHPLDNLRIPRCQKDAMGQSDAACDAWYHHWIAEGLTAPETTVRDNGPGPFLFGPGPSMADAGLVPQMANAAVQMPPGCLPDIAACRGGSARSAGIQPLRARPPAGCGVR